MEEKNYGLSLELERQHAESTDYVFGALSVGPLFNIPLGEREQYMPQGEIQKGNGDMMDCATRGPINKLEADFTYGVRNKKFSEKNISWLKEKGYIVIENGKECVKFSDAFNAIKSGTKKTGNSMKAPIHSIHTDGMIPKAMLPLEKWMRWEDYHDPKRITQAMTDLGKAFSKRFSINYEKVFGTKDIEILNRTEMVVVYGHAWSTPKKGVYPRSDGNPNHVWVNVQPEFLAFDNYLDKDGDFYKNLAPDYDFGEYAYRVFIYTEDPEVVDSWWSITHLLEMVAKLKDLLFKVQNQPVVVQPAVVEPSTPPVPEKPKRSEILFIGAKNMIDKEASPQDLANDEVACAESVCNILRNFAYPDFPMTLSTTVLLKQFRNDADFKATLELNRGYLIISATGTGNGSIRGHVGIIGENGRIYSNNSKTGLWDDHWTIDEWVKYYRNKGGMPIYVFEPL